MEKIRQSLTHSHPIISQIVPLSITVFRKGSQKVRKGGPALSNPCKSEGSVFAGAKHGPPWTGQF
jgi:hypothetical protein